MQAMNKDLGQTTLKDTSCNEETFYNFCRRPRRRRTITHRIDKNLRQQYGITRQQLDIILRQLCEQYEGQWAIVSTALYRQHRIRMNQSRIKDRYSMYLDPSLNKESFTFEEEKRLLKRFCLEGKRYKEIMTEFVHRDRYMIRSTLDVYFRRAIKMLEKYLWDDLAKFPPDDLIGNGEQNKYQLLKAIISNRRVKWDINKSSFKLLYFFMMANPSRFHEIPKDLAMTLYKRLVQMRNQIEDQNMERWKRIDPDISKDLMLQKERSRRRPLNLKREQRRIKYPKRKKNESMFSQKAASELNSDIDFSLKSENLSEELNWNQLAIDENQISAKEQQKQDDIQNFDEFEIQIDPILETEEKQQKLES